MYIINKLKKVELVIMKKIKFSVLMSVYKGDDADNVKVAIDSIINQTLVPNQIVIIADGPISEKVEKLLKEYQKNEIFNIYFRKENLGLGLTLKEGIEYCKYDYIARMDADDYSLPNRFEKQISFLEKNSDVSIIGSIIEEFSDDINVIESTRIVPEKNEDIKKFIKKRNPFNHPSVIFKKEDVLSVGNYKNVRYMQDYFLWVDLIANKYIGYNIQEPLVKMRADKNLFKRRSGKLYLKIQLQLFRYMRELKLINFYEYIISILIRCFSSLAPNFVREFMYKFFLRKKKKGDFL